ncbi:MAG: SpoIIE family protein phosphatase [Calditrichaeota bacterium]|nr:SpoIIE family protein phosphatase [Calditrichota bacterium]
MFRHVVKEQLKVPAKIDYLSELRDFVTKVGKRHGFSERIINAFKLSIDEAATNIIKHAYRDWEGDITIRAIVKRYSLTIVLIDKGKYFDPRQVSDPDLQRYVDIGKKGGLGIFIMRRLLDSIDYRKTEEGNELWLVKNRDILPKRKLSVSSIPLTLKVRYWLVSIAIFSFVVASAYIFFFLRQDDIILKDYLARGKDACSVLAQDVSAKMKNLSPEVKRQLVESGSRDLLVLSYSNEAVSTLSMSQHRDILFDAFIVDNGGEILATAKDNQLNVGDTLKIPLDAKELEKNFAYKYRIAGNKKEGDKIGPEVVDIVYPVLDESGKILGRAHFFINYNIIAKEISSARWNYLNLGLLVWIVGVTSLFILIYIVMNPFRRLQEWVKELGQPGVVEEMDIDASTEVGEIAKAFSDITQKLRVSQENVAEQERMQKEMQVAQEIQQTLLPSEFPEIDGYDISSYYAAAKEVGGDYYDFVEVDKDTLGIVVGDVSGKGVPGSLVMTMIRTALRTEARGIKDAAEVLSRVNDFVINDIKKGMFVTLFYVIIDSKKRRINYASAGHNPMILYRTSKNKTYYLNPRGFPIGISLPEKDLFRKSLDSDSIALAEDDILLVYTDGVTEAMNGRRQLYGEERFLSVIREYGELKVDDFISKLHEELLSFTEGSSQNDDITLVAIKEKSSADKVELKRAKKVFELVQSGKSVKESCELAGISTYAYYRKYKKEFENSGIENFVLSTETEQIEKKHLSIEEKTKIFDVIRRFPEYGAKKISQELDTERYNFEKINVAKIYEELVRARLNTKELREAFVARGGKKKRIKPPGTPLLTLDGRVIVQKADYDTSFPEDEEEEKKEDIKSKQKGVVPREKEEKTVPAADDIEEKGNKDEAEDNQKDLFAIGVDELLTTPLEDLFDKRKSTTDKEQNGAESLTDEDSFEYAGDASEESLVDSIDPLIEPEETIDSDTVEELFETRDADEPSFDDDLDLGLQEFEQDASVFDYSETDADLGNGRDKTVSQDDSEIIADLNIDDKKFSDKKIDREEVEFTSMVKEGGGMEEPQPAEADDSFEGTFVEDANIVAEVKDIHILEVQELVDPFEEFLEIEDEQGLVAPSGELDENINLLLQEQKSKAGEGTDDRKSAPDVTQNIARVELNDQKIEETLDAEAMDGVTFDALIDELENEQPFLETDDEFDDFLEQVAGEGGDGQAKEESGNSGKPGDARVAKLSKAIALYESQNYKEAISAFQEFIDEYPEDKDAYTFLGNSYFRDRKYNEAARVYEKLINFDHDNVNARENLGVVYASQGNLSRAIYQWERLLAISPDRHDIKESIERAKKFLNESPL